ncbi:HAD family hydrolase [Nonomuraea guangzhouensis]|uniref:HAD family hydrolase n=1 Tax=Nonomuraea guangzhouensis TaxID=1291555 RepID=A0ABW4GF97_9ACTN|nr:HAD family phosphatase [Nonomuraea guangzhouensis]
MPSETSLGASSREALQAVLFDMDGTLVDTEGFWWEAATSVARSLGVELSPADTPDVLGRAAEDVAAHLLSTAEPPAATLPDTARQLIDAFAARITEQPGGVPLIPGALDLLGELHLEGIPTALVSASPRSIVQLVLPRLDHHFALIVTADDTPRGKPHPDPYLKAANRLGVDPRRCVAIEDSPTGIAAATAAGCRVMAIDTGRGLPSLHSLRAFKP